MGLNQFHDILPGSAIAWVHRQARADYVRDIARLRDIAAEAGASIASARDDDDMRSNVESYLTTVCYVPSSHQTVRSVH